MRIRRPFRLVLVILVGWVTGGCATTNYTRSGFGSLPVGVEGKASASAAVLELEGVKVRVEGLDEATKGQPIPRLAIRIAFQPRELGYSFDPRQVAVRGHNGATWSPLHPVESRYQPLTPGSTFDLAFDVTVTSQADLELVLGGIARGTKRYDAVTLPLARRRGSRIERLYWLEAVGTFIAYAPYAR